jgi:hypothetical protein
VYDVVADYSFRLIGVLKENHPDPFYIDCVEEIFGVNMDMDIRAKQQKLKDIYDDFEIEARPFKDSAVCEVGCAFCCIHFGNVDAITLEGLIIHEWIETLDKPDKIKIRKKLPII